MGSEMSRFLVFSNFCLGLTKILFGFLYNFNCPHQSLVYLTPVECIERELAKIHSPVLPMWSASTVCGKLAFNMPYYGTEGV